MITAESSDERWAGEANSPKEGQDLPELLLFSLLPLNKHLLSFYVPSYFLSPSSPSSEPLPLRSDRGQHFSILQHIVCTLTDAPTHTTSSLMPTLTLIMWSDFKITNSNQNQFSCPLPLVPHLLKESRSGHETSFFDLTNSRRRSSEWSAWTAAVFNGLHSLLKHFLL